ncbi:hypothetical protein B0H11DRAFT_2281821 [Mycena galericulata]|nr:hypothetical protein B0H11DRAFT_2281821 [Mycena galericulata]
MSNPVLVGNAVLVAHCMFYLLKIILMLATSFTSAVLVLKNGTIEGDAFVAHKIEPATEVAITSSLVYNHPIGQDVCFPNGDAKSLRRLMVLFFLSGVVVASATLYDDIPHTRKSNIHVSHGRAYALTIMANVLIKIPTPPSLTPWDQRLDGRRLPRRLPDVPNIPEL